VLLAAVVAALAPPALARVDISRKSVLVRSRGAGALITRAPFRIGFLSSAGCAVLREVRNSRRAPKLEPATNDPIAPGFDNSGGAPLYAPLSFTVGRQVLTQYQGGIWGGNLMSGTRSGVSYSARNVLMARRLRDGVRLVVATNDPSGRRLR
jgi:hypothetical protein